MKMTLSNGTEVQLDLAPGATVTITKTTGGEKLELDGVELSSDPSVVYQAVGWVGAPKPKYTWRHPFGDGTRDYVLEVNGQSVGNADGVYNAYFSASDWHAYGKKKDYLGPFKTEAEAKAAVIAAWEAQNEQ